MLLTVVLVAMNHGGLGRAVWEGGFTGTHWKCASRYFSVPGQGSPNPRVLAATLQFWR